MGFCCKFLGLLVLLVAVFVGLLLSGFISNNTPLFQWLDDLDVGNGNKPFKGLAPVLHKGVPYGYTMQELQSTDLTDEVILVTGGNIGLGYWTALHLAKQNAKVVIGCRSTNKCEKAAADIKKATGKEVQPMTVDLSSFKSILAFTGAFKKKYLFLNSVILNAGIGSSDTMGLTEDGLESIIGINHFGHFLLTQELLPLVEVAAKSKGVATIVAVSSAAHFDSYPSGILPTFEDMVDEKQYIGMKAYGQSKLANVLFAQELSERFKSKGILVNSLHPGLVETQMFEKGVASMFVPLLGIEMAERIRATIASFSWTPEEASLTQLFLAVGKKVKSEKITGKYYHPIAREVDTDAHARDKTLQKKLWKMSEEFVAQRLKAL